MVIVKRRDDSSHWAVWHKYLADGTKWLALNLGNAEDTESTLWNSTVPTSSVISIGTNTTVNADTGTYVGYLFSSVKGFSKVGRYFGNGLADGAFIHTGFKPAFILCKKTSASDNWEVHDSKRGTYNPVSKSLTPNSNATEASSRDIDFLSNGFKQRNTNGNTNQSGATYVYIAFAESPFKYTNAE